MTPPDSLHSMGDLSLTLETLVRQPGIEPKNVIVFYNSTCCEPVRHLVNLFGFMSAEYTQDSWLDSFNSDSDKGSGEERQNLSSPSTKSVFLLRKRTLWRNRHKKLLLQQQKKQHRKNHSSSRVSDSHTNPMEVGEEKKSDSSNWDERNEKRHVKSKVNLFKDSIETSQLLFPEAEELILLESHLILSPDFLSFFGQMMPLLANSMKDPTAESTGNKIVAISAWNENGFLTSSSDPSLAYLAKVSNYIPRLAMMIPRVKDFDALNFPPSVSWSFDPYSFHHQSNFVQTTAIGNSSESESDHNGSTSSSSRSSNTRTRTSSTSSSWTSSSSSPSSSATGRREKYIFNHAIDLPSRQSGYIVFPDVSRVSLIVPRVRVQEYNEHPSMARGEVESFENSVSDQTKDHQEQEQVKSFVSHYMTSPRYLNQEEEAKIPNVDTLTSLSSYELMIRTFIDQSSASFKNDIVSAINLIEKEKNSSTKGKTKKTIVTVIERNSFNHKRFCKYFHLVNCKGHIWLKGIGSVIRFTVPYNIHVVLIDQSEL